MMYRLALGLSYNGSKFHGWQKQTDCLSVQQAIESALSKFAEQNIVIHAAGRTDAGVHALEQVIHFDANCHRENFSWVRGTNNFLKKLGYNNIAIKWAAEVTQDFHARFSAIARTYDYVLYVDKTPPSCFYQQVGYLMYTDILNVNNMRLASNYLLGQHDFSSFRTSICQAKSPIKIMQAINIAAHHPWYIITFKANAFLHHMVRNIMGCLIKIGLNKEPPLWMQEVLSAKNKSLAVPTFMPDGLYLAHIDYTHELNISLPQQKPHYHAIYQYQKY